MTKERELLARAGLIIAQYRWNDPEDQGLQKLAQQINAYFEESAQDEKPIAYWDTQNGKLIPAVPLSSERTCFKVPLVPLYLHPTPKATQEEEPIGYVVTIDPSKSYRQDSWAPWKEVEGMNGGKIRDDITDGSFVYLHPAPRQFVRLTDDEIKTLADSGLSPDWTDEFELYHFARAIEDALVEKNK